MNSANDSSKDSMTSCNTTVTNNSIGSLPSLSTVHSMHNFSYCSPPYSFLDDNGFFDHSEGHKQRSSSFGGATQYSQKFVNSNFVPVQYRGGGQNTYRELMSIQSIDSSTNNTEMHHQLSPDGGGYMGGHLHHQQQHQQLHQQLHHHQQHQQLHQQQFHHQHHQQQQQQQMSPTSNDGATSSNSSVGQLGADEDMGPVPRDRCNTWPMRRPAMDNPQTSPMIHGEIPEEDPDLYDSSEQLGRLGATSAASNGLLNSPDGNTAFSPGMSSPGLTGVSPPDGSCLRNGDLSSGDLTNGGTTNGGGGGNGGGSKKSTTRRNAWGNMSYADLITQAILQSPEQRLTLAQVYEWMVQNVPYFRDKGDSNSSAGWKNSIRHNLSLHSRFMRIQNEGAGKSSWWVINPDAKPGRNPRRTRERANTIDTSNKGALLDKKKGQRKKMMKDMRIMGSMNGSQASIVSHEMYDEDTMNGGGFEAFRARTQSNLSVPGSSARVSPNVESMFDDMDYPPWLDSANVPPIPSDIVDRTDQIRIGVNGQTSLKQEQKPQVKNFQSETVIPPPSYHELDSVRGPNTQNPLLRTQIMQPGKYVPPNMQYGMPFGNSWSPSMTPISQQSCGAVAHHHQHNQAAAAAASMVSQLPMDLENLTLPDQPLMGTSDMESLLRHELSQTQNNQLSFDL